MPETYDNTNQIVIWENKYKEKPEQPDFNATVNIDGVDYKFVGWRRNADDPANRPLAKFKLEKPKPAKAEKPVASPQESDPFEDDIPF